MITASSLQRLLMCPGSVVLPRAETHSEYADAGTDEHAELADMVRSRTLPANLAKLVPVGARAEVAIALNVATREARVIGEELGRDYGEVGALEIVGATDVAGQIDADCALVIDWKTGYSEVEPIATNAQMKFHALAWMQRLGVDRCVARIVYTKTGVVDEIEWSLFDLLDFADQLEQVLVRVSAQQAANANASVSTKEGAWCKYCPVNKARCPSKSSLLVQISQKGLTVVGDQALTNDRAADAYRQLVAVEQMAEEARGRLNKWVDENGPIDLGNGKLYGRYQRTGKAKLDVDVAAQVIADVVGPESAHEFIKLAIERSVSQAAIERAAKAVQPKGYTRLKTTIVKRIEDLGGFRRTPEYPYGEHSTEKSALPPDVDADIVNKLLESA